MPALARSSGTITGLGLQIRKYGLDSCTEFSGPRRSVAGLNGDVYFDKKSHGMPPGEKLLIPNYTGNFFRHRIAVLRQQCTYRCLELALRLFNELIVTIWVFVKLFENSGSSRPGGLKHEV
jgi:hypothetical protein